MATILEDLGFLEFFLHVFTFLFIFVLVYAVLDKFKLMGENKWLKLIAAFSVALLFLCCFNSSVTLFNSFMFEVKGCNILSNTCSSAFISALISLIFLL